MANTKHGWKIVLCTVNTLMILSIVLWTRVFFTAAKHKRTIQLLDEKLPALILISKMSQRILLNVR